MPARKTGWPAAASAGGGGGAGVCASGGGVRLGLGRRRFLGAGDQYQGSHEDDESRDATHMVQPLHLNHPSIDDTIPF